MQVWVVNYFFRNRISGTMDFGFTMVYKTKEAILSSLELKGFEMSQVRFERPIGIKEGEDYYVRYYPHEDTRMITGELQWVMEF